MPNWRVVGLAVYAIALAIMGIYGYVVSTSAVTQNASTICTPVPPGSASLPDCLPSETFSETGSALMYPMFQLWASHFTAKYPNVQINTANTGSGQGQSFVENNLVQIGGSAAYLSNSQQAQNPNILNIPLAVTATLIEYNVPGIPQSIHLNFTAALLTQIYNTTVQYWNDPRIIAINPGARDILSSENPPQAIWPFYRSDAAADTWLITQYLSTDPWWNATRGHGLSVSWPACIPTNTHNCAGAIPQSALGNPGIVIQSAPIKGSISYVSVEALDQWVTPSGLGTGLLQNQAGKFVEPSLDNVNAALDALSTLTPTDERLSLVNAPGDHSYPVVGYGYALVNRRQTSPQLATDLRTFLTYCVLPNHGSSMTLLNVYHFAPLPGPVLQLTLKQIRLIGP